ncbi:class I SAM-dependent methyltransferase [Falsiroseomonas tokyonensis]|uniref:Class I SAM-dependent methyltransferase n=1 Tax=Falsiroseomonas tokyonensis TaxID=430521 RepID=A0ABV7C344_9PROT|nr:methyltransferase domain-containing protein [Falsiroseomonas tokyonensis]MBU8541499.1 methyltransferase domain-containing protein [Falsiroseomonas tokyonensis]
MYPLEPRAGEIVRLAAQGAWLTAETEALLSAIGVGPGWHCLDLACGLGDVTRLMAARAGATGRVVGLDLERRFLDHAGACAAGSVAYLQGDACRTGLPEASFDLVHGRFLFTGGERFAALLAEAIRLVRPGGVVALQEQDLACMACFPPHPAFARLKALLGAGLEQSGTGRSVARRLFGMLRQAELQDVRYRPFLVGCQAGDPQADWLPDTVDSLRGPLLRAGLTSCAVLDETMAACRTHLADPGTTATIYAVVQVWGRKGGGEAASAD